MAKHYVCRRGRQGEMIVHGWNEFQSQCLRGMGYQLRRGEDWQAFANPEDAQQWLEENKLPDGEETVRMNTCETCSLTCCFTRWSLQ
jgi:viroplasmin and RNaseH domain-containing protein